MSWMLLIGVAGLVVLVGAFLVIFWLLGRGRDE